MQKYLISFLFLFLLAFPHETYSKASAKRSSASKQKTKKKSAAKKKPRASKKARIKKSNFKELVKLAEKNETGSLLIIHDSKFLVEKNWESPLTFYYLQGITSGVISLAMGPLVAENKLSLDTKLSQWIPEWLDNRSQISVEHLLQHTSGFSDDASNPWYANPDTWTWLKTQSPKHEPGSQFEYSDLNPLLLGFAIQSASGESPEELVKKNIFTPLKIQKWSWDKDKSEQVNTAGGLRLRTYDLLKIGSLFLNKGKWNKKKLISPEWIETLQKASPTNPLFAHAWWVAEHKGVKAYYSHGYQGQFLVVVPEKDLVAIRLRNLIPVEQNKPEQDWRTFPNEVLEAL